MPAGSLSLSHTRTLSTCHSTGYSTPVVLPIACHHQSRVADDRAALPHTVACCLLTRVHSQEEGVENEEGKEHGFAGRGRGCRPKERDVEDRGWWDVMR